MEEALKDERFSHILTDRRFRKMPRNIRKVAVDKRFKGMFKDKNFKGKSLVGKRGQPLNLTSSENLRKLYEVSSESSENDEDDKEEKTSIISKKCRTLDLMSSALKKLHEVSSESSENDEDDKEEKTKIINKKCQPLDLMSSALKKLHEVSSESSESDEDDMEEKTNMIDKQCRPVDLKSSDNLKKLNEVSPESKFSDDAANKDSSEESDDSDDDSESDDSSEAGSEDFDHHWEEHRNEAPDTNEITHRIAVCNMDWDRIRADDLFACFDSFKPTDGCINSLKIYPSEYGLKRMEEEKIRGPPELVEETLPLDDAEEPQDKKGSRYHREKLRQYQINRLKYYYAVIDCDSPETANALYEQLNGMEYESSSVTLDLRFIPDDVTFDTEPTSVAEKAPNPTEYKPKLFVTSALQQVKVNLTWDETDPKRRETLQKAFTEPDNIEKDIKDYLASSSGESDEEELDSKDDSSVKLNTKDRISKYKELLLSLEEKKKEDENKFEMEITWEPGLKEKTEEIVKNKMKKDHLNPFDEMIQKKQEERKLKRKGQKEIQKQESDDESADSDDDFFTKRTSMVNEKEQNAKRLAELALISDRKETNLAEVAGKKCKKSKFQKKQQEDNFKMDINDPRFSAIYSSHLYNIDPVEPHYKAAESNSILVQEKQRKLKSKEVYGRNKNPKKARYF